MKRRLLALLLAVLTLTMLTAGRVRGRRDRSGRVLHQNRSGLYADSKGRGLRRRLL